MTHTPRLAWDGARMLVHAAQNNLTYAWMADRLGPFWPADLAESYEHTRRRLLNPDRVDVDSVEAGVWRARLDQLVQLRPELAGPLAEVIAEVRVAAREQRQAGSWLR